jgi:hypothetical protein
VSHYTNFKFGVCCASYLCEQAVLIFEGKIFRKIYGAKYEDGEWKIRTSREFERDKYRRKYTKMDKGTKDKLAGSTGENGGG